MAVFGPGVGGGLLAAAGALGGVGQGLTAAGQQQQKLDLETHMNDLATKREETLERLRAGTQKELQAQQQAFEQARQERGIGAASAAAGATRTFEAAQETKKEAAAQKRTETAGQYRVQAREAGVKPSAAPRIWDPAKLNTTTFDPKSHMPMNSQVTLMTNRFTGGQFVQTPQGMVRANSKGEPMFGPESFKRNKAADVQGAMKDLYSDPLGVVPEGQPRAGMPKVSAFEEAYGYIPNGWSQLAASKANPQQHPQLFQAQSPQGGNTDEGAADNAAQADEDRSNAEPAFQSGAMSTYGAVAGAGQ